MTRCPKVKFDKEILVIRPRWLGFNRVPLKRVSIWRFSSLLISEAARSIIRYSFSSVIFCPVQRTIVSATKFFKRANEQPPQRAAPTRRYPPPGNGRVSNAGISIYSFVYTDSWLLVPTVMCIEWFKSCTEPKNAAWLSPIAGI